MMPKRKIDSERRNFKQRWETEYMFINNGGKPMCLICGAHVAVKKEFNIRRHYETKHRHLYMYLDSEERKQKAEELKMNFRVKEEFEPPSMAAPITSAPVEIDQALKASFVLAQTIAKSGQSFTDGEFLKSCMMVIFEAMLPDKREMLENMDLSENTISDHVCKMAADLKTQLNEKSKEFIAYSLAVDARTDMADMSQLAIFIRGVDSNMRITEEMMDVKTSETKMTGKYIFESVCQSLTDMKLSWKKLIGLATNGTPAMCDDSGLLKLIRAKMQEEDCTRTLASYHCIMHHEPLCREVLKMGDVMNTVAQAVNFIRGEGANQQQFESFVQEVDSEFSDIPYYAIVYWPSRGKILTRFFELYDAICEFMESKGEEISNLKDEKWKCELAFLADVTAHLNALNQQLQEQDRTITDMYEAANAFQVKLQLWEMQMQQSSLPHFPCCQVMLNQVGVNTFPKAQFAEKLSALHAEIARRFSDLEARKQSFELLRDPFSVNVETAPAQFQLELIELQCNLTLKAKYEIMGQAHFIHCIPAEMSQLRLNVARTLCMFGNTHLCEKLFAATKLNKQAHGWQLTDETLYSILRVSTAQNLAPNFDKLSQKRCQISGSV